MAVFDFSIKVCHSSTGEGRKSNANPNTSFKIVHKDVSGVVGITLDASFFVICNGTNYPIATISYACGKRKIVYSRFLDKNKKRVQYIREAGRRKNHLLHYLPFAPGLCVHGNVVIDNITKKEVFRIKKIYVDWDNEEGKKQLAYFRRFYDTITTRYKKRLFNV